MVTEAYRYNPCGTSPQPPQDGPAPRLVTQTPEQCCSIDNEDEKYKYNVVNEFDFLWQKDVNI